MNLEPRDNPFELGGRYENRKGFFTVTALTASEMRIRWDSGEETTCRIEDQARYVRSMQRDAAPASRRSGSTKRPNKPVPPPTSFGILSAAVINPSVDATSMIAEQCHHCHRDLSKHPIVMIGSRAYCYRCAKAQYPSIMENARRARNDEARMTAPALKEYKEALHNDLCARQRFRAQREAAARVGFYTEGNKWLIVSAIAIPCGILLPVVGLLLALPILIVLQPIWNRERDALLAAFDSANKPPPAFDFTEPKQNYVPDPIVSLHPDSFSPALIGTGYDRYYILRRDDFSCQSCGRHFASEELEVHHVLPKAQCGSDSIRNLITLCKECHFHEDWFDHVHKHNQQRIEQVRKESSRILKGRKI